MAEPTSKLPTIGERIRQLRYQRKPRITQRELAELAGVSVDLIAKLEQGTKQTALLTNLHKIATAFDVEVGALLARPVRVEVAAEEQDGGVLAIRRAITSVVPDEEPTSLEDLHSLVQYAWRAYWTNRFDVLAVQLPPLLHAARATDTAGPSLQTATVLSDAYCVAASMLTLLGYVDLGYVAMDRAIGAADRSEDELRRAAFAGYMSWVLLHQTGTFDQAQRLAVEEADRFEPRFGKASPEQLAVWLGLLVCAAVAAGRDGKPDEADDLLNLAEAAATRLSAADYRRLAELPPVVVQPIGMPQVIMQQVDVSVVTGRHGRALEIAKRMPPDAGLPLAARARHLADVAYAQTGLGRDRDATETLLEVEQMAPHWMRYQAYPRTIVRELMERERRARTPLLRGLAARLDVA
jgi:transcriptional regulator with XRE-family HTH domain